MKIYNYEKLKNLTGSELFNNHLIFKVSIENTNETKIIWFLIPDKREWAEQTIKGKTIFNKSVLKKLCKFLGYKDIKNIVFNSEETDLYKQDKYLEWHNFTYYVDDCFYYGLAHQYSFDDCSEFFCDILDKQTENIFCLN